MEENSVVEEAIAEAREKMARAISHTEEEFATIRTGRASPGLVEGLKVDYYGTMVQLRQIASFAVPEPRVLVIHPYDRSSLQAIEKAITGSNLGLVPSNDGQLVRIVFPPLTEERRRELAKVVKQRAEEGRVAVRNVRRHVRHTLEEFQHDGDISSDELDRAEKELDRITHEFIAEVDRILSHKEQELLET
ncbi:MAG: ribosome recycling factor [Actinobacteria bacterium]|jgi:ribosome recycling factor|nr:ribosome recycling factor [Actinomycetota bacterium]MCL6095230.1 ribosome recycling factor [Actinomycetota bacterium]